MEKRKITKLTALILAICLFVSMQMSGFCVSATEMEGSFQITVIEEKPFSIDDEDYQQTTFRLDYPSDYLNDLSSYGFLNNKDHTELLGYFDDFISVLEIQKDNNVDNKPIVVVQHGFFGCKESKIDFIYRLAKEGYCVIAIDSYLHGSRASESTKKIGESISSLQIALRTTVDLDIVLEYYLTDKGCNINNYAMVGESMGALATYNQLAFGKYKPSVIVPIIGTPDIELLDNSQGEGSQAWDSLIAGCYESLKSLFIGNNAPLSPINSFNEDIFNNTDIFAMNVLGDCVVPVNGTISFFDSIYENIEVENKEHIYGIYHIDCIPSEKHKVTEDMVEDAIGFIKKHTNLENGTDDINYDNYILLKEGTNECLVNGQKYTEFEVKPIIGENGQTLLPIRSAITSFLGWNVEFDYETYSTVLTKSDGTTTVTLEKWTEDCNNENTYIAVNNKAYLTVGDYEKFIGVNCREIKTNLNTYVLMTPATTSAN